MLILIAETDKTVSGMNKEILEMKGHQVTEAHSIEKATKYIKTFSFDIIIVCMTLPHDNHTVNEGEGFKIIKKLSPVSGILITTGLNDYDLITALTRC